MANGDTVFISSSGQQQTRRNSEQHGHPAAWSVKAAKFSYLCVAFMLPQPVISYLRVTVTRNYGCQAQQQYP